MKFVQGYLLVLILAAVSSAAPNDDLIEQGRRWGVQSILTGERDPELEKLAQEYAQQMADKGVRVHWGFGSRAARLFGRGYNNVGEIEASSGSSGPKYAAWEAFRMWRGSPGHWGQANQRGVRYGFAMVKDRWGNHHCIGLFGRKK